MSRSVLVPSLLCALPLCAVLAGCAEAPFLDSTPQQRRAGEMWVCHDGAARPEEIAAVAREACAEYRLGAQLIGIERYQCRVTTPHRTLFYCE